METEAKTGIRSKISKTLTDPAFISILLVNGVLIGLYKSNINEASTIVFTYYMQSLLIGIMHFIRIASLKNFETKGFTVNGSPLQNIPKAKWSTALFFAFHYGFFHFVYFIFLGTMMSHIPGRVHFTVLLSSLTALAIGGIFETRTAIKADHEKPPMMALLFFAPYLRIVPMHLFIFMAFTHFEPENFLYFLLLKTAADIITYLLFYKSKKAVLFALGSK